MAKATTRTVATVPITGTGVVTSDGLSQHVLVGMQFTENGDPTNTARVLLRNGLGGDIYVDIRMLQGESMEESYDLGNYYHMPAGIYVDVVGGTIRGSIRCRRSP